MKSNCHVQISIRNNLKVYLTGHIHAYTHFSIFSSQCTYFACFEWVFFNVFCCCFFYQLFYVFYLMNIVCRLCDICSLRILLHTNNN